jgi:hypothetical protein
MSRGDIFHDGLLGYWIIHEKPKDKKLFCVPLEKLFKKKEKDSGCCNFFHELEGWNFKGVKVVCNLYKEPGKAKKLIGKDNYIEEAFMKMYNNYYYMEAPQICEICNLPTDGEKCYYKRCPVQ